MYSETLEENEFKDQLINLVKEISKQPSIWGGNMHIWGSISQLS